MQDENNSGAKKESTGTRRGGSSISLPQMRSVSALLHTQETIKYMLSLDLNLLSVSEKRWLLQCSEQTVGIIDALIRELRAVDPDLQTTSKTDNNSNTCGDK